MRKKKLKKSMLILLLLWFLVTPIILGAQELGDVNADGSINIVDALLVAHYYVGLNPAGFSQAQADVDCDGAINIVDALLIARFYVGLIDEFPCSTETPAPTSPPTETPAEGEYILLDQSGWSLVYVDSEETSGEDGAATNFFDGDTSTFWHTEWESSNPTHPHEIQIDIGGTYDVGGIRYLPRQDEEVNGTVANYEVYVSTSTGNWGSAVASGTWANDKSEKEVLFGPVSGRYVRLRALSEVAGNAWTSGAELNVLVWSGGPTMTPVPTSPPTETPEPTETTAPTTTPVPGNSQVQPFPLSQVSLSSSRFTENRDRTLSYLRFLDADRMLYNFRVAAGLSTQGASAPGGWDAPDCKLRGHSTGHLLKALSQAYAGTGDSQYKTKADYIVTELGKCQDALYNNRGAAYGFLSAYSEEQFILLESLTTYPTIWAPYYTLHKILAGLLASYELTGNSQALDIASKVGEWVYNRLSKVSASRLQQMWSLYIAGEYGGMNDSLANLYEHTGNSMHLSAARFFDNDSLFDPCSNNQDQLSGKHANQHIPQTIGALRVYDSTNDSYYYNIANNFWYMVSEHHAYIIGGTGEGEMFKGRDQIAAHISSDTCETCCAYNMLKLTRQLFFHDPRPEYMDYYERTLYNQILGSQDPNSSHGFTTYFVPLNPGARRSYSNDYSSFTCCHGTGMENHTKYQEQIYSHSSDNSTLYVNLFISSTLNWSEKGFTITQSTSYPAAGTTTITVNGSGNLVIMLRVPFWVKNGYIVSVNGTDQHVSATPGTYISINRNWTRGDQITIDMPLNYRLELTPDDRNTGGILYGPIVLAGNSSSTSWISLSLNTSDLSQSISQTGTLRFSTNGISLLPFYEATNISYHTYFRINN
jgi:DUF1680 family protein